MHIFIAPAKQDAARLVPRTNQRLQQILLRTAAAERLGIPENFCSAVQLTASKAAATCTAVVAVATAEKGPARGVVGGY